MRFDLREAGLILAILTSAAALDGGVAVRGQDREKAKVPTPGLHPKDSIEIHIEPTRGKFRQLDPVQLVVHYENISDATFTVDASGSPDGRDLGATLRFLVEVVWLGPPERGHSEVPGAPPSPADLRGAGEPVERTGFSAQARAPKRSYFERQQFPAGRQSGRAVKPFAPGETREDKVMVNLLHDMTRVGRYEIRVGLPVEAKSGHEHWVVWGDPVRVEITSYDWSH